MNQKSINLLSFELAFYEIYDDGYDPLKTIREFWSQHTIDDCQEKMSTLFENYRKSAAQIDATDYKRVHAFFTQVYRLLIAYFLVHFCQISIGEVSFVFAKPAETIGSDLKTKKKIHDFFNRIAE